MKSQIIPGGNEIQMSSFSISLDPVTFHLTLHRILAGFIARSATIADLRTLISKESLPDHFLEYLIEHPLRIQSLVAQIRAGMWIRNGNSIFHQIGLYRRNQSFYDDGII